MELRFEQGTLLLTGDGVVDLAVKAPQLLKFDSRCGEFRARACDYAMLVRTIRESGIACTDSAGAFHPVPLKLRDPIVPRPHQTTAFEAWRNSGYRGVAALPTGSGKTILAVMAIARLRRSTLVLVPTIDLLAQWAAVLERFFRCPVGMWGGGSGTTEEITVSTYNSAVLKMEFSGGRFAFLVADECHHLPGPVNRLAAEWAVAPYRLGLSATPEGEPEHDRILTDLMGPVCCRVHIDQLEGKVLADYEVRTVELELTPEEQEEYDRSRKVYLDFLHSQRLVMNSRRGWRNFIAAAARSGRAGQEAFQGYLRQRAVARSGENKLLQIWELLTAHAGERIIVFTADNATAYTIGRRYFLPVLTHHTKAAERKAMLERFRTGVYPVLVSSRVLNEGVDVPEANIGIVVSGGAGTREHVQRLGRILRARPGKRAILYELVNSGTSELGIVNRRREHRAYQSKMRGILC